MIGGILWRTAYDVDFTAQSSQNIRTGGNGNKTIGGKVWTWANDANLATANITNGTGLVLVASSAAVGFYEGGTGAGAPNLTMPISTVLPGYDINNHVIRVMTRVLLTGADVNGEGAKLFMYYAAVPQNQICWMAKWFVSPTPGAISFRTTEAHSGVFSIPYTDSVANSSDDILGLVFKHKDRFQGFSGAYVSGEKMRLKNARGSFVQDMSTTLIKSAADLVLGICMVVNNSSAALTTTFTHFRVDYAEMLPPL